MQLRAWRMLVLVTIGACLPAAYAQLFDICVNTVRGRDSCRPEDSSEEIGGMALFAVLMEYLSPQVDQYSLERDTGRNRSCSEASSSLFFCASVVPRAPDVCQPVGNPGMNLSGLCTEMWRTLQLLAPLRHPRFTKDEEAGGSLIPRFHSVAERYCNSSVAPTCPPLIENKTVNPTCSFPFVQRSSNSMYGSEQFERYLAEQRTIVDRLLVSLLAANDTDRAFSQRLQCLRQNHPSKDTAEEEFRRRLIDDLGDHKRGNGSLDLAIHLQESRCAEHCNREGAFMNTQLISFISNCARFGTFLQLLFPVLVVLSGIKSGFEAAWEYPNRLTIYLAVAVVFHSSYLWPHFGELFGGPNIACNSDNSLALSDELKASSLAQFSCIMNKLGIAVFRMVLLFVTFAWWQVIIQLQLGRNQKWYCIDVSGRGEVLALVLTAAWAATLAGVQIAGKYTISIVVHACVIEHSTKTLHFGIDIAALLSSCIFIVDGCRRLFKTYRLTSLIRNLPTSTIVNSVNQETATRNRFSSMKACNSDKSATKSVYSGRPLQKHCSFVSQDSRQALKHGLQFIAVADGASVRSASLRQPINRSPSNKQLSEKSTVQQGLRELQKRFFLYLLGAVISGSTAEFFIALAPKFVAVVGLTERRERELYYRCSLSTCGDSAQCDHLRPNFSNKSSFVLLVFTTLEALSTVLLCSEVFSPLWWQSKLSRKQKTLLRQRSLVGRSAAPCREANQSIELSSDSSSRTSSLPKSLSSTVKDELLQSGYVVNWGSDLFPGLSQPAVDIERTEVAPGVAISGPVLDNIHSPALHSSTSDRPCTPPPGGQLALQTPGVSDSDFRFRAERTQATVTSVEQFPDDDLALSFCTQVQGLTPVAEVGGARQRMEVQDVVFDAAINALPSSTVVETDC